jgi:hypothetical protein
MYAANASQQMMKAASERTIVTNGRLLLQCAATQSQPSYAMQFHSFQSIRVTEAARQRNKIQCALM